MSEVSHMTDMMFSLFSSPRVRMTNQHQKDLSGERWRPGDVNHLEADTTDSCFLSQQRVLCDSVWFVAAKIYQTETFTFPEDHVFLASTGQYRTSRLKALFRGLLQPLTAKVWLLHSQEFKYSCTEVLFTLLSVLLDTISLASMYTVLSDTKRFTDIKCTAGKTD